METSNKLMDEQFYVMEQFASFGKGTKVRCIFYDDRIEFRASGKDAPAAKLMYRHIMEVYYGTKTELKQVNKSPLARAMIGSLLYGKTGAMAGIASSMQGKKSKQVIVRGLIIGYNGHDMKEHFIALQTKDPHAGQKAEELIRARINNPPKNLKT
ncbi:MAG: hypothetical protein LIO56_03725 [Lachnospiraceae bacterium]|nr:hypothetical protein [Lachnospiraceae bacterium]